MGRVPRLACTRTGASRGRCRSGNGTWAACASCITGLRWASHLPGCLTSAGKPGHLMVIAWSSKARSRRQRGMHGKQGDNPPGPPPHRQAPALAAMQAKKLCRPQPGRQGTLAICALTVSRSFTRSGVHATPTSRLVLGRLQQLHLPQQSCPHRHAMVHTCGKGGATCAPWHGMGCLKGQGGPSGAWVHTGKEYDVFGSSPVLLLGVMYQRERWIACTSGERGVLRATAAHRSTRL